MGRKRRQRRPVDPNREIAPHVRHQVPTHETRREGMQGQPGALDGAGGEDHGAVRTDAEELPLSRDVNFYCVNRSIGRVKLDDVGAWHEEQPAVRVSPSRTSDVLPDRVREQREAAVLVETEQTGYGW